MSSQDSWSCLSVQEFFSLCNWQAQKEVGELRSWGVGEKEESLSYAPLPLCPSAPLFFCPDSWQYLSVQKFFSLCNWQGQTEAPLPLCPSAPLLLCPDSWQCLSVKKFFSLCSWQGQSLENRNGHHADPSSRLKEQVREFFQFIPWEGNPEIGSLPKVSSIPEPTPSAFVETTLTDLSELF